MPVLSATQLKALPLPTIASFGRDFSVVATGITAPKKVACLSSRGEEYVQLLKRDEIRSDVVVQQLFLLLNDLLAEERAAGQDGLLSDQILLRTYKVVCITSSTGVLEFVQNSMTIRDYLVDDPRVPSAVPSAHRRYHKGEIDNTTILKQFARVKQESKEQKVRLYRSVKQQFTPVLHYFFLERFFHPQQWFYSVTNFTSTLSISSIVGYIVGLGDRHLRNIMIDSATGQLIHIDFGILFEKGRLLSVPEMVPFRLTRELVDCLGLEGVDGLLRAQMEFCLRLLRRHKDLIVTILEVFLHDPLNQWKTPTGRSENEVVDNVNTSAEQVLFRIENKIMGRDMQNTESISVEKQVDVLLKAAMNEDNLAMMFHGWSAWL
ncbi:hypothetical protein BLSTO_03591 [Blastocystis sp. subtype 1]